MEDQDVEPTNNVTEQIIRQGVFWRKTGFGAQSEHGARYAERILTVYAIGQPWQPKDHEMRTIPLAESAINVLAALQSVAPENCPYVFMEKGRWDFYREKFDARCWQPGQSLVNNMLRRFKTICRKVGIGPYSIHDLRRSCITNWAKVLPLHVVQKLAGHSSIQTTQTYYLSIQEEDMQRAQAVQEKLLEKIPASDLTDPLLTHFGQKRVFLGRKRFGSKL